MIFALHENAGMATGPLKLGVLAFRKRGGTPPARIWYGLEILIRVASWRR
jgi:hypothetical protein